MIIYPSTPSLLFPPKYFKSLIWTLVCLVFFVSGTAHSQWTKKADMITKRAEAINVLYKNKLYVFGGFYVNPVIEKTNEVYDIATNKWSQIASFPVGKEITHQGIILVDDNIWLIGGRAVDAHGPASSQVIIYNITTNKWSNGPEIINPATGIPFPMGAGGYVLIGRTIHVFGGFGPTLCDDQANLHLTIDVDKYMANRQSVTWENKLAPMPIPRNHMSYVALGGKIYVLGGQFQHDCGALDQVYCHMYDPVTNIWTRLTDLPIVRSHAEGSTFAVDGKIYLVAGQGVDDKTQNTVYQFDPKANNNLGAWSNLSSYTLPGSFLGLTAKLSGSTFIINNGALYNYANSRAETYAANVPRTSTRTLGFSIPCFTQSTDIGKTITLSNLLYCIEDESQYNLTSNANWLTVTKNGVGTTTLNGVNTEVTINTIGLAPGNYTAAIKATGASANVTTSFCVNLEVKSSGGNQAPVLSPIGNKTAAVGQLLTFIATASDAVGQTKTFSLENQPAGASINLLTGAFSWIPTNTGNFTFKVKATDNGSPALSDEEQITVSVGNNSAGLPIRINAGGDSFNASSNRVFISDQYFGGTDKTSSLASGDILNTTDDAIYFDERSSTAFNYSIPMPNGTVNVVLHFAEIWFGAPGKAAGGIGKRMFNVDMEGSRKLSDYDIFAEAGGALTAIQETFPVTVTDGVLNINFTSGSANLPTISAIEVLAQTPANSAPVLASIGNKTVSVNQTLNFTATATDSDPGQTKTFSLENQPAGASINLLTGAFSWTPANTGNFTFKVKATDNGSPALSDEEQITVTVGNSAAGSSIRINAGGAAFNASGDRPFIEDQYFGGIDGTSSLASGDIQNTTDDALYLTERSSPEFDYSIPVQNGTFNVVLHFAEIWYGAPGKGPAGAKRRMFNVDVEGSRKLTDYDIFAEAGGALKAIQETFPVTVTDGVLNIDFTSGSVNMPKISAIEVLAQTPANSAPVLASIGNKTVSVNQILNFTATASDPDPGQTKTFSLENQPAGASINLLTGAFSWTPANTGNFTFKIKVTDNGSPTLSDEEQITVTVGVATASIPLRINAGGTAFSASGNRQFIADQYFGGTDGTSSLAGGDIDNTTDDVIYLTERSSPEFDYSIPVQNGTFNVVLHFAEIWYGAPGKGPAGARRRMFNVDIENSRKLTDYDIFAEAGGALKAIQETFPVTVTDGVLNIDFTSGSVNMPKISAIEVLSQTPTANSAPVLASIGNKTTSVNQTLNFTATATDANSGQTKTFTLENQPAGASINLLTGAFSWTPATAGNFTFKVKVTDNGSPTLSDEEQITVTVGVATASIPIRINAGGTAFSASGNRQFIADQYFGGTDGTSSLVSGDIANTTDDALYLTERSSPEFDYSVPVQNGAYSVVLHFAEIWYGAPGKGPAGAKRRMFNVDIEDSRKLTNFDIFDEAGGALRAIQETFDVMVTDGVLNIDFTSGSVNMPKISAIEILAQGSPGSRISQEVSEPLYKTKTDIHPDKSRVYPNPIQNRFAIDFAKHHAEDISLQLISLTGKTYSLKKPGPEFLDSNTEVDISHLSLNEGIYLLKIQSAFVSEIVRIMITE